MYFSPFQILKPFASLLVLESTKELKIFQITRQFEFADPIQIIRIAKQRHLRNRDCAPNEHTRRLTGEFQIRFISQQFIETPSRIDSANICE